MFTESDLSEIITNFTTEPFGGSSNMYQRAEDAAKQLANDTYAANIAAETLPAVRMLSWNDVPTAVSSILRYPVDLGCAQLQAWLAWVNFVDEQFGMLFGAAFVASSSLAVRRLPELAPIADRNVVPFAVRADVQSRVPRRTLVKA